VIVHPACSTSQLKWFKLIYQRASLLNEFHVKMSFSVKLTLKRITCIMEVFIAIRRRATLETFQREVLYCSVVNLSDGGIVLLCSKPFRGKYCTAL